MTQYAFPLPVRLDYSEAQYIVTESNQAAYHTIKRWPEWDAHALIIHGEAGCGKTHLGHIWTQVSQAVIVHYDNITKSGLRELSQKTVVVEDIGGTGDEQVLLHLYNATKEAQGFLLMTSHVPPAVLETRLPDLRSRLLACSSVSIGLPDDILLSSVLRKQCMDRQLMVPDDVVDYAVARVPRSLIAVSQFVDKVDQLALMEQRAVTIPLARKVLETLKG